MLITVSGPTQQQLDTVTVTTSGTAFKGMNLVNADLPDDMAFNLVVSC